MTPRDIACRELVELLTEYLEGALPPGEVAAVEGHLAGCAGCERYLDQMRATVAVLGRMPTTGLSARAYDALLAAFGTSLD